MSINHEAEHTAHEAHLNWLASIPVLAKFTTYARDGEAGINTIIFPKNLEATPEESYQGREVGRRVTRVDAQDASGMEEMWSWQSMGECQYCMPTLQSAEGIWIVQQVWYANV
jgi:hypothetical protein